MTRVVAAVAVASLVVVLAACAARAPAPKVVGGVAYGVTREPFHGRWWNYYERGVSWSLGGFWAEAEADFRACLERRTADSRRARTYGMHFVQCFAHRELAAALIEQGRLDEAEREARISAAQEPSAKTAFLLERIARLRAHAGAPAAPAAADRVGVDLVVERVAAAAGGGVSVEGHADEAAGAVVAVDAAGATRALPIGADGRFAAALAEGETLALRAPDGALRGAVHPAAAIAPRLELDGPEDDRVVAARRAWYRFRAASAAGLTALVARDEDGRELARVALSGVEAGGMVAVAASPGAHRVRFVALDSAGADGALAERRLVFAPPPEQDAGLRAVATIAPLASPSDAGGAAEADDARFQQALDDDARFRVVDGSADTLIAREARLAEAGWLDPDSVADFGRRLRARYALAATLRRGRGDVECFVRVVHVDTGRVVASADAYAPIAGRADEDAFFAAVAARVRQAFPVLAGDARAAGGDAVVALGRAHGVIERMRFHVLRRDADLRGPDGALLLAGERRAVATLEAVEVGDRESRARRVVGAPDDVAGPVVSE